MSKAELDAIILRDLLTWTVSLLSYAITLMTGLFGTWLVCHLIIEMPLLAKTVIRVTTVGYGVRRAAAKLGFKLWDQLLMEEIAHVAKCDRTVDPRYSFGTRSCSTASNDGGACEARCVGRAADRGILRQQCATIQNLISLSGFNHQPNQ
jgi:hypothetical protein